MGQAICALSFSAVLAALRRSTIWPLIAMIGTAAAAQSLQESEPRRWESTAENLPIYETPSLDARVVGVVGSGAVLSNSGCSRTAGDLWCKVRPFRGGAQGFAKADALTPARGPDGVVPMGADDTGRRAAKRDFDAKGQVSCAQERGHSMGTCAASVARGTGGDATLVVTFPNGFARRLYFVHGEFVRASATMSGAGRDTGWRLENGVHYLRVDDQRFEVPDALVFPNG